VQQLLFGAGHEAVTSGRVATIQSVGSSGGLKVGADFLAAYFKGSQVWVSDPTWENHRFIFDRLSEEMERAMRYDQSLSVVLCDLDRFKLVNDTHGHLVGDAVLREGAAALRRCLRTGDLLGRYGGEEFLAVLPQFDLEAARLAAERLRASLEGQVVEVGPAAIAITASFGVAALSELRGRATPDLLVSLADRRLYEAKAAGRNRVRP